MISREWLAGFFDGEGCITGSAYNTKSKYVKHPWISIQVSICQKDRKILELIQKEYGGNLYPHKNGTYVLKWTDKAGMMVILNALAPYSFCKKDQILLAIRFVETKREENLGCEALPDSVQILRKELHEKIRSLKVINND